MREKGEHCKGCSLDGCPWVPPEGPSPNVLMFVGEAPGEKEVELQRPFCGPSGIMLNEVFAKCGIIRTAVYISNSCVCRPPNNSPPQEMDINHCRMTLFPEVAAVNPKVIVALGRTAFKALMALEDVITPDLENNHGKVYPADIHGHRKILYTYHPAAALRSIFSKERLIADLADMQKLLDLPRSEVIIPNRSITCDECKRDKLALNPFCERHYTQLEGGECPCCGATLEVCKEQLLFNHSCE